MAIESIQHFLLNFCLGIALTLTTSPVWAADKGYQYSFRAKQVITGSGETNEY